MILIVKGLTKQKLIKKHTRHKIKGIIDYDVVQVDRCMKDESN